MKLENILDEIQRISLELHENFEFKTGERPVLELEQYIFEANRKVAPEILHSVVWNLLIYSPARTQLQQKFQLQLQKRFPGSEYSFIWRQLNTQPVKIWSFRRSLHQKAIAHTICGPQKFREVSLDDIVSVVPRPLEANHYYGLGWTISFDGKMIFVMLEELTQAQCYKVEEETSLIYPIHQHDEDFWEEVLIIILKALYPVIQRDAILRDKRTASLHAFSPIPSEPLPYNPGLRLLKLSLFFRHAMGANWIIAENNPSPRVIIARAKCEEDLLPMQDHILQSKLPIDHSDENTPSYERILEAFSVQPDASMPKAHRMVLANHPYALLMLRSDHPVRKALHQRESIRQAIQWGKDHPEEDPDAEISKAFDQFEVEQRWITTFSSLDLNIAEHNAICSFQLINDDLRRIFPAAFWTTAMDPPQELLLKFMQDEGLFKENRAYTVEEVVNKMLTIRSHRIFPNLQSQFNKWLLQFARTWRNVATEIETSAEQGRVSVDAVGQNLLHNGLASLASLFGTKNRP